MVEAKDFTTKICVLVEGFLLAAPGIFQLSDAVKVWLIDTELVFMEHPTLPCLFARCCVLTINFGSVKKRLTIEEMLFL